MSARRTLFFLLLLAFLMLALSYAFVPLYSLFCKATGYLGYVDDVVEAPSVVGKRVVDVYFNADLEPGLPFKFYPERDKMSVRTGTVALAFFYVENLSDEEVEAVAIYNVVPYKAAKYFKKIACFCFDRQVIQPGKRVVMPVSFFLDSTFDDDAELIYMDGVTLSYTFFNYGKR